MKTKLTLLLAVALCAAVAVSGAEVPSMVKKPVVKIGVILPLTGEMEKNGADMRASTLLRLEEQKNKVSKYDYKVIFEDNQGAPRQTAEAFKKLTEIDHVDMVMTAFGGPGTVASTQANIKKIVHIGCGFSPKISEGSYNFNNFTKPGPNAELSLKFLKAKGYKKVALIGQIQASTNALEDFFEKGAPAYGLKIVGKEKFPPGERDFRVALLKLREAQPDVLIVDGFDPEGIIIARQMREIGFEVPISSMACWDVGKGSPLFYGYPFTSIAVDRESHYTRDFKERFHRKPMAFCGMIYDSLDMYIHVCEQYKGAGNPDAEFVAKELSEIKDYPGVMGTLTPDADRWFAAPPALICWTKDGLKTLSFEEALKSEHPRKEKQ